MKNVTKIRNSLLTVLALVIGAIALALKCLTPEAWASEEVVIINGKLTDNHTGAPIAHTEVLVGIFSDEERVQWSEYWSDGRDLYLSSVEPPLKTDGDDRREKDILFPPPPPPSEEPEPLSRMQSVKTDAEGHYRLVVKMARPRVNPSYLYFSAPASDRSIRGGLEGYPAQWHTAKPDGYRDWRHATPVTLTLGTNTIETALEPYNAKLDIQGTLIDNRSGVPIAGIDTSVHLYDKNGRERGCSSFLGCRMSTDADGHYRLMFKMAFPFTETYYLEFHPTDQYPRQWHTADPEQGYRDTITQAQPIILAPGPNMVKTVLEPYVVISGTLVDNQTWEPLAHRELLVRVYNEQWEQLAGEHVFTDSVGRYQLVLKEAHPVSRYLSFAFTAERDGTPLDYPEQWHTADPDDPRDRERAALIRLVPGLNFVKTALEPHLKDTVILTGRLTDNRTGNPIPDAQGFLVVYGKNREKFDSQPIATDAEGYYTLKLKPIDTLPATYTLKFVEVDVGKDGVIDYPGQWHTAGPEGARDEQHAVPITLKFGFNNVETALEPYSDAAVTIEGKLKDAAGLPVANISGTLIVALNQPYCDDYETKDGSPISNCWSTEFATDADGYYHATFKTLSPGHFFLQFSVADDHVADDYPTQWHQTSSDGSFSEKPVPVTLGYGTNSVATVLYPRIIIEGQLIDGRTGSPITNTQAFLDVYSENYEGLWWHTRAFTTDAYGQYRESFPGPFPVSVPLRPGVYYLKFFSIDVGGDGILDYPDQWHTANSDRPWDEKYAVPVTLTKGINTVTTTLYPQDILLITSPQTTTKRKPVISGRAEPGSVVQITIELSDGTRVVFETTADRSGYWNVDTETATPVSGQMGEGLSEGEYLITVKQVGDDRNAEKSANQKLKVDMGEGYEIHRLYLPFVGK